MGATMSLKTILMVKQSLDVFWPIHSGSEFTLCSNNYGNRRLKGVEKLLFEEVLVYFQYC